MTANKKRPFNFKQNAVWAENLAIIMRVGLTMALSISVFFYFGYLLDRWLGTKGIFIVSLTLFGIVGGARTVYRQVMDLTEKNDDSDKLNGTD